MISQSKEFNQGCKESRLIVPSPGIQRNGVELDDEGSNTKEQWRKDKKERKATRKAAQVAGSTLTKPYLQHDIAACYANRDEQVCNHFQSAVNLHVSGRCT